MSQDNANTQNVPDKSRLKSAYAKKRTGNITLVEVALIQGEVKGRKGFDGGPLPKNARRLSAN